MRKSFEREKPAMTSLCAQISHLVLSAFCRGKLFRQTIFRSQSASCVGGVLVFHHLMFHVLVTSRVRTGQTGNFEMDLKRKKKIRCFYFFFWRKKKWKFSRWNENSWRVKATKRRKVFLKNKKKIELFELEIRKKVAKNKKIL